MQVDPLTPAQREVLAKLKGQEAVQGFYLAGGSALALRLGHRRSRDHDFFREEAFVPADLNARLSAICGPATPLQIAPGTLTVQLPGVKLSFFQYRYPLVRPPESIEGLVPAASLLDIALMKLAAIADRGARKDFIDLYAILRTGIRLPDVLAELPRKFPGADYQLYHFLKALSYFEDAKEEPLDLLDRSLRWEEIQEFFRQEVSRLAP